MITACSDYNQFQLSKYMTAHPEGPHLQDVEEQKHKAWPSPPTKQEFATSHQVLSIPKQNCG